MKKWIALILVLALTLSMIPVVGAAAPEQKDAWTQIEEIENNAALLTRSKTVEALTRAYTGEIESIVAAVLASPDYVPGSMERHGNFFFWLDKDGDPNGYSPSLRARLRSGAVSGVDPEDFAATVSVDYGTRGGSAGSMNVAAFQPYIGIDSSFTAQYENRCKAIAQTTGGTGTTYKTSNANINNIGLALSTCGVVIFDSHGTTDYEYGTDYTSQANSSYLCLTTSTGITTQDKQSAQGEFGTYYHAFNGGGTWCIDGTAMQNHMTTDSPNGMLWMAICLGMATDGLEAPLRNRGMEVVYGYSQSVTFTGDYKYDGFFWPHMCEGYTVAESAAYMKTKAGCNWDPAYSYYSYSQAVSNRIAFPIVASSEDEYPGHGNVDVIQVPVSTWTLFPQFELTAVSNNEEWGTVSVNGKTIHATPAEGCYVAGYEVIVGEAQVVQNGNNFDVTAEADCTVQINFALKTVGTVQFSVPEGVSCEPVTGYVGEQVVLPAPEGTPTADAHTYKFLGWASETVQDTMELPSFLKPGSKLTLEEENTTLYALYTYFIPLDGMAPGQFLKVKEGHTSWAGEYVITYNSTVALDASGTITGNSIGGSKAAIGLEAAGCEILDDALNYVPDSLVFEVAPTENGTYSIKMKGADNDTYLAATTDTNALNTATNANKTTAHWTFSMTANGPVITSAAFPGRSLQFNDTTKLFRCFANGAQKQLTLYVGGKGDTWYTTQLHDLVVCDEHTFSDWTVITEPTCTEAGQRSRVCTVCGYRETEAIDALGHDFGEWTETQAPTCTEAGEETRTCSRCGETETRAIDAGGHIPAEAVKENETEPTCTEAGGYDSVVYCTVCGEELSREHTEIPALGHAWGEPVYEWTETEDGWNCTATVTCENDASHVESETVSAVYAETATPDYTAPGAATWTATFTDERFTEQVKKVELPQLVIRITFQPGEADGVPVPGESFVLSTADENIWSETAEKGKFFLGEGKPWICFPDCSYEIEGYHFLGWKAEGDERIWGGGQSWVASEVTYTAMWAKEYHITAVPMGEIGEWDGLNKTAGENENIFAAVQMNNESWDAGYRLEKILVCDPEGEQLFEITTDLSGASLLDIEPVNVGNFRLYTVKFTMPASDVVVTAVFREPEAVHDCPCAAFTDMPEFGTVEHDAIDWAFTHEPQITNGTSETTFGPEKTVTRGQAVTFLWRAAGCPEPSVTEHSFTDVKTTAYYYKAMLWAVEKGITNGTSATKFSPNKTCTTEQILTFIYRFMDEPEVVNTENPWTDVNGEGFSFKAIMWAVENGIAAPKSETVFGRKAPCTRAAIVTFLYRIMTGNGLVG